MQIIYLQDDGFKSKNNAHIFSKISYQCNQQLFHWHDRESKVAFVAIKTTPRAVTWEGRAQNNITNMSSNSAKSNNIMTRTTSRNNIAISIRATDYFNVAIE